METFSWALTRSWVSCASPPLVITVYGGRAYHGLQGDSDTLPLTHPVTLSFLWVSPLQPRASADVVPSA